MILRHPTLRALRRFALEEASRAERGRVARHLMRCHRCQARVRSIRNVVDAIREDGVRAPVDFESIAARIQAGERVIPTAEPPPAASPRVRRYGATAATVVALVAAGVVLGVPEARADRSELWVSPAEPVAGESLTLRYQATPRLRDEDRLVVRARYYVAQRGEEPRTAEVGTLVARRGGAFEGTATLPDSAVYAVLAVEDPEARFVDSHAERWEVLVHAPDGRPFLGALRGRYMDNRMRNTRVASQAIRAMTEHYPDEAEAWYLRFSDEASTAPREAVDSLRAVYRSAYDRIVAIAEASSPDPSELWSLAMLAGSMEGQAARDRWRDELIRRYPTSGAALQQAALAASSRYREDVVRHLAVLDSIWQTAPDSAAQAAFNAWNIVQRLGDDAGLVKWGTRFATAMPGAGWHVGTVLSRRAAAREDGMALIREAIAGLDGPARERPLTLSRDEAEAETRRVAARYHAALGRALLEAGRTGAARDTLDLAVDGVWDPTLFQAAADARLMLGDTAGALELVARVAADPVTQPARADSLRASLGEAAHPDETWQAAVEKARAHLRHELLQGALDRAPLRARLRLQDLAGQTHDVRLADDAVTVIAFWSRYCPPSRAQLGELDRVAERLADSGVRFLAISDEHEAADVAAFMDASGHTFPTFLDPHRDARNAFDNRSVPYYVVLDPEGRIRFTAREPGEVVRQVAVLSGTE